MPRARRDGDDQRDDAQHNPDDRRMKTVRRKRREISGSEICSKRAASRSMSFFG